MIDTDKYEGHNRGNWSWGNKGSTDNGDGTIMIRPFTQLESKSGVTLLAIHHGDAKQSDLNLIADAPLLLAEVKELQAWKAEVERICRTMNGPNRDTALFIMTNEVEEE